MTKSELLKKTKDQLLKKAKGLGVTAAQTKEQVAEAILKAGKKKKTAKKKTAAKKAAPAKKAAAKKAAKKSVTKKTAAKKTTTKKTAAKKTAAKKSAPVKKAAKKAVTKKATAKKTAATESAAEESTAKKTAPAKKAAKKAAPKKATAKKTAATESAAEESTAKKTAPAKKVAKKSVTKKTAAKKTTAKKTTAKKTAAKKTTATKSAVRAVPAPAEPTPPVVARPHTVENDEQVVSDAKYHIAETGPELETENDLPDAYRDDRVWLLVRDPFWIHAFWDINPATPDNVALTHGINRHNSTVTLRVYDVTDVDFDGSNAHSHFDLEVEGLRGNWYIELPADNRNWIAEVGLKDAFDNFVLMSRSNHVLTPREGVSPRTDEMWLVADDQFWRMYALSGGFRADLGPGELTAGMKQRLQQQLSSGGPISSSGFSPGGSPVKHPAPSDDFPFELDCELIVYGKTRPDATVTLKGEKISLREDGTFTARYALPDGLQVIEAEAESADGKYVKTITPTVSRSTARFNKEKGGR